MDVTTAAQVGGWAMVEYNFPPEGNTGMKVKTRYTNEQGVVDNARMTQSATKVGNVIHGEVVLNQVNDATALGGKLDIWFINGKGEQVQYTINFTPGT